MSLGKVITKEDRQWRLPWWGVLCVIVGAMAVSSFFAYYGEFALALPTLVLVGMLATAIAMRWKLRRHAWFWITMTLLAAFHVPLVLFVPWTTRWMPAIVIYPIGFADLYMMLAIVAVVGRFTEGRKSAER